MAAAALAQAEIVVKSPGVSPYTEHFRDSTSGAEVTGGTALWFAETGGGRTIGVTGSTNRSSWLLPIGWREERKGARHRAATQSPASFVSYIVGGVSSHILRNGSQQVPAASFASLAPRQRVLVR